MIKNFSFSDRNVNVSLSYEDLQRIMNECVTTTMKVCENEQKQKEKQMWYDTSQVAQLFGVHVSTINRWKHSGYLTPRTIGNKDYFSKEEITNLVIKK